MGFFFTISVPTTLYVHECHANSTCNFPFFFFFCTFFTLQQQKSRLRPA
jgi:hypothetical protein